MFNIFGFYKFKRLSGLKSLKKLFKKSLIKNKIRGTIIFQKKELMELYLEKKIIFKMLEKI